MIDKKYIDKVLDEVDLAEVVSDYGVKLLYYPRKS